MAPFRGAAMRQGVIGRFSSFALSARGNAGVLVMSDPQQKAAELRRHATLCVKIAERLSLRDNRDRMMKMAQHFLQLAQQEDAKAE